MNCEYCGDGLSAASVQVTIPSRTVGFCGILCARNALDDVCARWFGETDAVELAGQQEALLHELEVLLVVATAGQYVRRF